MDSFKQKIVKGIYISICILLNLNSIIAQNNLKGHWKAQQYTTTCWASTLSNLTKVIWTEADSISEKRIRNGYLEEVLIPYFTNRADSLFNFRMISSDSVLTYEAINCYLRYKYPRPLIHSYNFIYKDNLDDDGAGHFVNIVGCSRRNNLSLLNRKWLKVYDPKPDSIGTTYLRNYESYQILDPKAVELQGTFFNFVRKPIPLPRREDNDVKKAFYDKRGRNKYNCDSCFLNTIRSANKSDILLFQNKIKEILTDSLFSEYVGKDIHFKKIWNLEIIRIIRKEKKNAFETIEKKDGAIFIINYAENDTLKGGTTLKYLNSSNKYLIDRVEDISRYDKIKEYFQSKNKPKIVIVKDQFRFLRFKEKKQLRYIDMDNLFKSNDKTPIVDSVFKQKIKPLYRTISEGGRRLIEACQKLVGKIDSTCFDADGIGCRNFVLPAKYLFPQFNKKNDLVSFIVSLYPIGADDNKKFTFQSYAYEGYSRTDAFNTHCPTCYPEKPVYFPYDIKQATNGNLNVLFVPITDYKILGKFEYISDYLNWVKLKIKAIYPANIKQIGNPRLESFNGYLNTDGGEKNLLNNYSSIMSSKGIICDVLLKDGTMIQCYILCDNTPNLSDPNGRFQWKE